jgi:hypothetical protein
MSLIRRYAPMVNALSLLVSASAVLGLSACGGEPPPTQRVDSTPVDVSMEALPGNVQAISLLGDTLRVPSATPEALQERQDRWALAKADYDASPDDPEALIWLGRRTATSPPGNSPGRWQICAARPS